MGSHVLENRGVWCFRKKGRVVLGGRGGCFRSVGCFRRVGVHASPSKGGFEEGEGGLRKRGGELRRGLRRVLARELPFFEAPFEASSAGPPPSVEPPRPDPPSAGPPKISLFSLSHHKCSLFLPSLGVPFVEFWWCFEAPGPQMCSFGILGLCETTAASFKLGGASEGEASEGNVLSETFRPFDPSPPLPPNGRPTHPPGGGTEGPKSLGKCPGGDRERKEGSN